MIVCTRHILSELPAKTGFAKGAKSQVLPTANYQLPTTNCNGEGQCAVNYRTKLFDSHLGEWYFETPAICHQIFIGIVKDPNSIHIIFVYAQNDMTRSA